MSSEQERLLERLAAVECPAFRQRRRQREGGELGPSPIVLARGEGSHVWDANGRRYLDLAAGFGSALLGHGHPALTKAITEQSVELVQGLGDVYSSRTKLALLEALAAFYPSRGAQVLLGQSGGDAVTAAMKTASLSTGRSGFIAFDGAYHGLGYAPLGLCGFNEAFRAPFAAQLSPHVRFAPYPGVRDASAGACLDMLRAQLDDTIAAVLVEPILGRGGCVVPPDGFLNDVAELTHEAGALLIVDEIWTGLGRTGALLRSRHEGIAPDILCLGKGLGGGVSVSACVASADIMAGWARAQTVHTSTHAGAPLACAAALATLATLEREGLVERANVIGSAFRERLAEQLAGKALVRGAGLMVGVQLDNAAEAQRAMAALLEAGFIVITGGVAGDALTLTPALTIELDALVEFGEALAAMLRPSAG